ncbi:enhancer of mRNA-decapping protein 4 isoform X1 [Sphaerodactylus townsendi]|uniref:Enhancer of mRNA decapping 4 n=1 Tax=Sphaerodactylus townsendi TaxID=933632 RepID=A0ACB8EAR3_9SAUR|nr:enhancer of mRNA-decapping protein 4 isoform X1 [Sphaerodactylus townsendi]
MASASMDIEDATQHLRDILKLDRPGGSVNESQRPPSSYNGDLNGLLVPDSIAGGDGASLVKPVPQTVPLGTLQEKQVICLSGDDSSTCMVITAKDIEIVASSDSSITSKARGSNKVKIQPVARYDWEQKYYYGNLIAVSNAYLAYAIRVASNGSAMVRVLSVSTAERTLLKGFTGGIADLAFAHLNSNQLACLDEAGNLFVWCLAMESGKIQEEIWVNIKRPDGTPLNSFRRIIWCPFIPDENDEACEEGSQTLALLHEDRAEVWDLDIIRSNHSSWPVEVTGIKEGFIVVKGHSTRLSEGALSPDGTVLATASHDGYVKFWQIYIEGQDEPRCLHEWKPHDGRPLSCLLFCDNHKKQDPEVPFWRFLITGADQNRELKMWCTVSWTCLQTVRFSPDIFSSMSVLPSLKACLDLSAEYLILSDVQRKVLYVMELVQNQEEGKAYFSSISEFLLTHPVLSFGIQVVSRCRLRHTEVLPAEEESDNLAAEGSQGTGTVESAAGVLIKLFCVHTKALQDVQIRFQPLHSPDTAAPIPPHGSHEDFAFPDHLADLGTEGLGSEKGSTHGSQPDVRRISELSVPVDFLSPSSDMKPKLMTPDAFMTPSTSLQQITVSPGSSISSLTAVTSMSTSVNEPSISRAVEEVSLSPKLQLDTSLTLSSSTGSLQTSPRNHSVLLPGLSDKLTPKAPVPVSPANPPLVLDRQDVEPLAVPQSSPTRERSPDVISSASTAMSQDIPEIASETLQRSYGAAPSGLPAEGLESNHHADSMASAASALHLLSPRNRHSSEHSHHSLDVASAEVDMLSTPSLLETALPQENAASDASVSQPWPAAPDITRETRNSMADSPRNEVEEKHKSSYHRHSYHLLQHDSQDASAEQSDHDDEVASLASSSVGFGAKAAAQRHPVKDWKAKGSPRTSPKLKRKGKKEDGSRDMNQSPRSFDQQIPPEFQDELMCLLRSQQREIADLRQNQMELMQRLTDHLDSVQSSLMGHIERVIDSQQEQEQRRLDQVLAEGQQRSGQLQEHLSQQLSQSLSAAACNRLERTVREEMKKTVPPCISKTLEPITGQLSNTIAAKLTAIEGTLKENVVKMVKSKNLTDAIARATTDALQGPMQSAYREAFQSVVLPAFEKSCQSMFQQINDTFKQGTQEYIQQLEIHMKNKKAREQDARDSLLGQLRQLVNSFQSTTDQLASTIASNVHSEVQHQLHILVGNMQESILAQVQRVIKGEVNTAMKEQQAAVTSSIMQAMRSAAGTPIPAAHLDFQSQQAHVLQLLQQGHLNQAFQQALTAADLNLVLYVCETVDPQQVFGQHPCPLSQPVILSLIQQLSSDLGARTELKLNYLEEAVMHLDHSDPITRDHMGSVMNQVRQKLFQFLQAEPHNTLSKPARRLMIMLQGLATPSMS